MIGDWWYGHFERGPGPDRSRPTQAESPDTRPEQRPEQGHCSGTGSAGVSLDLKVGSQREAGVA